MAMIVDDMDWISNLPEPIMEQILSRYLPASDSIRVSFASRTWERLWKSLPVSDDFDVRRDGRLDESMEEIVTSIDESLRIFHEHEVRKHIIPSFRLRGRFSDEIQTFHVDCWMKLVTKHYVKRLVFYNYGIRWYKFPPAAFDVGSLVALSLYKCVLKRDLIQGKRSSFCCLKELELTFVDLNGLIIGDLDPFQMPFA
ncbi:F-box/FBD/LRR-repeat protein At3g26920-like [Rosa chinensis]|uniref:F-box/FBD/LRR-repeat protein At3g26920-like n=1 Tax=Rosa chinensis TaxID=74649 RepID=UPI000D0958DD|nr:F-box/FBD/LRR-repeat protein At3g26920-like [Rosa chinensis]